MFSRFANISQKIAESVLAIVFTLFCTTSASQPAAAAASLQAIQSTQSGDAAAKNVEDLKKEKTVDLKQSQVVAAYNAQLVASRNTAEDQFAAYRSKPFASRFGHMDWTPK